MRFVFLLAFPLAMASSSLWAQVYRWVDEKGTVHYSNTQPPQNTRATTVDIDAKPGPDSPETTECYTVRCQGERLERRLARREEAEARRAAERAAAAPKPARGLDFRRYVSIQRGMSEGELLGIAGDPDMVVDQGLAITAPTTVQTSRFTSVPARTAVSMKTYTYMPTAADPFTTTITLVGGRVSDLERVRKF